MCMLFLLYIMIFHFTICKENLFFQNVIFDSFTILSTQKNVVCKSILLINSLLLSHWIINAEYTEHSDSLHNKHAGNLSFHLGLYFNIFLTNSEFGEIFSYKNTM